MAQPLAGWPELPLAPWRPTRDTLHMWTQIVGKTLLASPIQNHWWHCALRVSARGLATPSPIVAGDRSFEVELDFVDHLLAVRSDRRSITTPLVPRTVRSFFEEYLALLHAIGWESRIRTTPVEVPDPIPFDRDEVHRDYDPAAANRFWQVLRRCDAVFRELAGAFVGKQSPVHFWWGSFDLASTRFSGRRAPERPGADRMMREAYSHEVISFGFWPGGSLPNGTAVDEPLFFAYAAPPPEGFGGAKVEPGAARYDQRLGEFVLPYEAVRTADDPAGALRAFCETVYQAGATLGRWDRDALERR
ncbi:MAG TPA: DUF5996 family protein [Anaeromyxobacteraceae bacterium]|nr:DUF5996 family protein [Anaeromyxobacteraceae bacterium]